MRSRMGTVRPPVLVEQGDCQMLRLHLGVSALLSQLLGGGQRFLGLEREPFQLHR